MKLTIIGAGNIGTLMAAEFANKGHKVTVYSRRSEKWKPNIEVFDSIGNLIFRSPKIVCTSSLEKAIEGADIVWITTPSFTFQDYAIRLEHILKSGQKLCIVPGSGGAEFIFHSLIQKGVILMGLQRVHSIARLVKYGQSVKMLGRKDKLYFAAIPKDKTEENIKIIEELFSIPAEPVDNYLAVTLTPSNPILHTTRLYSMFKDRPADFEYENSQLFYEDWDVSSSEVLLKCDDELTEICEKIPLNLSYVQPLRIYYEGEDEKKFTEKIKSIDAFKGLTSPMYEDNGKWKIDWDSRYFTADFPFGLKVIIEIARLFNVETPEMDKVWNWYHSITNNPSYFEMEMRKEEFLELYA